MAASGTINESENNNTVAAADKTYDDYDNYGAISSTSDVDWWKVTFTQNGEANFWLGNIPSGCNYNLYLYKANGSTLIASSKKTSNSQELITTRVKANTVYTIKIVSTSGSSTSKYKFRVKNYNIGVGYIFTFNCTNIDTTGTATEVLPHLWYLGYDAGEYRNNSAASGITALKKSNIFIVDNHGNAGRIRFDTSSTNLTRLYATNSSLNGGSDRAIMQNVSGNGLSNVDLVLYMGCLTGNTDPVYGNLVDATLSKGARCVYGWTEVTNVHDGTGWTNELFVGFTQGNNAYTSSMLADFWASENAYNPSNITSWYAGASDTSLVLDTAG